ncbi:hypothetical protein ACLKA6_004503 [Drosophila palustris]
MTLKQNKASRFDAARDVALPLGSDDEDDNLLWPSTDTESTCSDQSVVTIAPPTFGGSNLTELLARFAVFVAKRVSNAPVEECVTSEEKEFLNIFNSVPLSGPSLPGNAPCTPCNDSFDVDMTSANQGPVIPWQKVQAKKRSGAPLPLLSKKKGKLPSMSSSPVPIDSVSSAHFPVMSDGNRFASLSDEDCDVSTHPPVISAAAPDPSQAKQPPKPRPITIPGVTDIIAMEDSLNSAVSADSYEFKLAAVMLETSLGEVLVAAAYLPPRLYWNQQDFNALLLQLGQRFIIGGDFNAKHRLWGNHRADSRGLAFHDALAGCSAQVLATGRPTFFPYNRLNVPSCLDFFVYKGMPDNLLSVREEYDLSSDHLPLLASISSSVSLSNGSNSILPLGANISKFRQILDAAIHLNMTLSSTDDVDNAVQILVDKVSEELTRSKEEEKIEKTTPK